MNSLELTYLIRRLDRANAGQPHAAFVDAIEAITEYRDKALPLGLRLAGILDASRPLLDAAARRERTTEAGKPMRQITHQHRADGARAAVELAQGVFGFEL